MSDNARPDSANGPLSGTVLPPSRNRRTGWIVAAVIAAGLTGAAASSALSHGFGFGPPGFGPGAWHGRFMGGPLDPKQIEDRADRMVRHVAIEIDATNEQQEKLRTVVQSAVKDILPMREKAHAARARARELLTQDKIDRAEIEKFRTEQARSLPTRSRNGWRRRSATLLKSLPPSSGVRLPTACRHPAPVMPSAPVRTEIGDKLSP